MGRKFMGLGMDFMVFNCRLNLGQSIKGVSKKMYIINKSKLTISFNISYSYKNFKFIPIFRFRILGFYIRGSSTPASHPTSSAASAPIYM